MGNPVSKFVRDHIPKAIYDFLKWVFTEWVAPAMNVIFASLVVYFRDAPWPEKIGVGVGVFILLTLMIYALKRLLFPAPLSNEVRIAYQNFARQKKLLINSYDEGTSLQLALHMHLGQKKVPRLADNPGLNAQIGKENDAYNAWLTTNGVVEADFAQSLAMIRTSFAFTPGLEQLLQNASAPYRPQLSIPEALDTADASVWLKSTSKAMHVDFDTKVRQPLNALEDYLTKNLD